MTETKPRLVTFGISHYCEKARWALDWHGIDYEEISWAPGVHQILAKRCGAESSILPILLHGNGVTQGSDNIIDWADQNARERDRVLTHSGASVIERRADDVIGIHVRRLGFARTLPRFAHLVKPAFFSNTAVPNRLAGNMMWPITVRVIMKTYDITPSAASDSRDRLNGELDWLESLLSDGRPYLTGDRLSRADIAVASSLAHIARPADHGRFYPIPLSDTLRADYALWQDRPAIRWVRELYRDNRHTLVRAAA